MAYLSELEVKLVEEDGNKAIYKNALTMAMRTLIVWGRYINHVGSCSGEDSLVTVKGVFFLGAILAGLVNYGPALGID